MTWASVTVATHTVLTATDYTLSAPTWNGYKVYLSAPRHPDSGARGECGWEENINGRNWNMYAANIQTNGTPLRPRGYHVTVSANARTVNGYITNRNNSNNWGANVHIVTHTNAPSAGGCGSSAQYLLVMYESGNSNSTGLRSQLLSKLDPAIPGGQESWNCDGLYECTAVNAPHVAYVELFFHTNQSAVNWFQAGGGHGTGVNQSWLYAYAVDAHLGYPR